VTYLAKDDFIFATDHVGHFPATQPCSPSPTPDGHRLRVC